MTNTINDEGKQHSSSIPSPKAAITIPHGFLQHLFFMLSPSNHSVITMIFRRMSLVIFLIRFNYKKSSGRFSDKNIFQSDEAVADAKRIVNLKVV